MTAPYVAAEQPIARDGITFTDLVSRFTFSHMEGRAYRMACPVCVSHKSLDVTVGETGKALLRCWKGCDTAAILAAVGLEGLALNDVDTSEVPAEQRAARRTTFNITEHDAAARQLAYAHERAMSALDDTTRAYARDRHGLTNAEIDQLKLGTQSGGLFVPLHDADGNLHTAQTRAAGELKPRQPRWSNHVLVHNGEKLADPGYGIAIHPAAKGVMVTEGISDYLTGYAAGWTVVGVTGAAKRLPHATALRVVALAGALPLAVAGDRDTAGENFNLHMVGDLTAAGGNPVVVDIPAELGDGGDLTAWRDAEGDVFPALLEAAVSAAAVLAAAEAAVNAAAPAGRTAKGSDAKGNAGGGGQGNTSRVSAKAVVEFITNTYDLYITTDGGLYGVKKDSSGHRIVTDAADMLGPVQLDYYEVHDEVPSEDTVKSALRIASTKAERSGVRGKVHLRAASEPDSGEVFIDLADEGHHVVHVTGEGWDARMPGADTPMFRRTVGVLDLPVPEAGGDLHTLRELLRMSETDPRWRLVRGWLATAFLADKERPILWFRGGQGSGKSMGAELVLSLVNPVPQLGREPGRKSSDDSVAAVNQYTVAWDNVSKINDATSDVICRTITGVAEPIRQLYTQRLQYLSYMRTGVATSLVVPTGLGNDALDRVLDVPIVKSEGHVYATKTELRRQFKAARAQMFGAVLSDLAGILRHYDEAERTIPRAGRLSDYSVCLHALDLHLGLEGDESHLQAYLDACDLAMTSRAHDDDFTVGIRAFLESRATKEFEGTAREWLTALSPGNVYSGELPEKPQGMGTWLTKALEPLRAMGVTGGPRVLKGRTVYRLRYTPSPEEG